MKTCKTCIHIGLHWRSLPCSECSVIIFDATESKYEEAVKESPTTEKPLDELYEELGIETKPDVCPKCGDTGRCEPQTLDSPDGQECDCLKPDVCRWVYDIDNAVWKTDCGLVVMTDYVNSKSPRLMYLFSKCPRCGLKIERR